MFDIKKKEIEIKREPLENIEIIESLCSEIYDCNKCNYTDRCLDKNI